MSQKLVLLSPEEQNLRREKLLEAMQTAGVDAVLLASVTNLFYLTGRVFLGYILLLADGTMRYYVKRPVELSDDALIYIRKPEDIPATIDTPIHTIGIELDALSYNASVRLLKLFADARPANASALLQQVRSVKTPGEIDKIRYCAERHDFVYSQIPKLYREGMTDFEFQIEIESVMRREGCLGQLRASGDAMEIHMGSLIAGANADEPSPYDFSMGGAGLDPSLPVGASGDIIHLHESVMVDMNGDFNGYMSDMSRTFAVGSISDLARRAHDVSIEICRMAERECVPGYPLKYLYTRALEIVDREGLTQYYMGHRQHAAFIGHGVGIEINEQPVVTARSKAVFVEGNVIALEPKFVIPGVGAVGIENTYLATASGLESFNHAPEEIIQLFE